MSESRKDRLLKLLNDLQNVGEIEGSAIVTRDGLLVTSYLPEDINAETFAAMSAAMMGAAETAVSELEKGLVERVITESDDIKLVSTSAGEYAMLVSIVPSDGDLGLVIMEMKKTANLIQGIMYMKK